MTVGKSSLRAARISGWTYSQSGTPVAYILNPNDRRGAVHVPCDTWWQALRFALSFVESDACEFVGGPGDGT